MFAYSFGQKGQELSASAKSLIIDAILMGTEHREAPRHEEFQRLTDTITYHAHNDEKRWDYVAEYLKDHDDIDDLLTSHFVKVTQNVGKQIKEESSQEAENYHTLMNQLSDQFDPTTQLLQQQLAQAECALAYYNVRKENAPHYLTLFTPEAHKAIIRCLPKTERTKYIQDTNNMVGILAAMLEVMPINVSPGEVILPHIEAYISRSPFLQNAKQKITKMREQKQNPDTSTILQVSSLASDITESINTTSFISQYFITVLATIGTSDTQNKKVFQWLHSMPLESLQFLFRSLKTIKNEDLKETPFEGKAENLQLISTQVQQSFITEARTIIYIDNALQHVAEETMQAYLAKHIGQNQEEAYLNIVQNQYLEPTKLVEQMIETSAKTIAGAETKTKGFAGILRPFAGAARVIARSADKAASATSAGVSKITGQAERKSLEGSVTFGDVFDIPKDKTAQQRREFIVRPEFRSALTGKSTIAGWFAENLTDAVTLNDDGQIIPNATANGLQCEMLRLLKKELPEIKLVIVNGKLQAELNLREYDFQLTIKNHLEAKKRPKPMEEISQYTPKNAEDLQGCIIRMLLRHTELILAGAGQKIRVSPHSSSSTSSEDRTPSPASSSPSTASSSSNSSSSPSNPLTDTASSLFGGAKAGLGHGLRGFSLRKKQKSSTSGSPGPKSGGSGGGGGGS